MHQVRHFEEAPGRRSAAKLLSAVIILVSIGLADLHSTLLADDFAPYTEYLPSPNCETPRLLQGPFMPSSGSTLDVCESMYKNGNFIEWGCESEASFRERTAPQLLEQSDMKWLANVVNRKKACMDLLAEKGKLDSSNHSVMLGPTQPPRQASSC